MGGIDDEAVAMDMIEVAVQQEMDIETNALQHGSVITAYGTCTYYGNVVLSRHA